MKKTIFRFFDLVLGGLLIALVAWPLRLYRVVRGPCDRGPAVWRKVCALMLYFACYAALFEVTARGIRRLQGRTTEPSWRYVDDRFLYAFHPYRAMQLRPGADVREGVAGFYLGPGIDYVVNEHGGRGPALAPKASGRARIICVGGSSTFGPNIKEDDTWPARLAAVAPEWSVMNCGVSGYTSRHVFVFLQGSLFDLQPDLVIVYLGRNDLHANESFHGDRFHADYSHMHGLRRERRGLSKWLVHNTWTFCTFARWRQDIPSGLGRVMRRQGLPITEMGPRGLAAFRRNIEDMLALAARRKIAVVLMSEAPGYLPVRLADGSANPHLDHLAWDAPGATPEVYTTALRQYGDEMAATGAAYVDLASEMPRDPAFFIDSIHLSRAGGDEIARRLLPVARSLLQETREKK